MINKNELFLLIYMYELEQFLNQSNIKEEMHQQVFFHSDEANVDRPLKEYIKQVIEAKISRVPYAQSEKRIRLVNGDETMDFSYEAVEHYVVRRVYLPDEITDDIKMQLKDHRMYTDPDLLFEIENEESIFYETLEMKSTKKNAIPGSSVQQVTGDEWVLFVQHTKKGVSVSTGKYGYAVNQVIQFPDRSPRPAVAFNELVDWNRNYRTEIEQVVEINLSPELLKEKLQVIENWEDVLVERWIEVMFSGKKKKNEPWFNHTLQLFMDRFLNEYENMSLNEKEGFRMQIKKNLHT